MSVALRIIFLNYFFDHLATVQIQHAAIAYRCQRQQRSRCSSVPLRAILTTAGRNAAGPCAKWERMGHLLATSTHQQDQQRSQRPQCSTLTSVTMVGPLLCRWATLWLTQAARCICHGGYAKPGGPEIEYNPSSEMKIHDVSAMSWCLFCKQMESCLVGYSFLPSFLSSFLVSLFAPADGLV